VQSSEAASVLWLTCRVPPCTTSCRLLPREVVAWPGACGTPPPSPQGAQSQAAPGQAAQCPASTLHHLCRPPRPEVWPCLPSTRTRPAFTRLPPLRATRSVLCTAAWVPLSGAAEQRPQRFCDRRHGPQQPRLPPPVEPLEPEGFRREHPQGCNSRHQHLQQQQGTGQEDIGRLRMQKAGPQIAEGG